eukprot:m.10349 g.10349  ORF g.10349 m.10349 type:complete len:789 (+) comp8262_c0_seq1:335-2701(+)
MSLVSFRSLSGFDGKTADATVEEAINVAAEQGYSAVALSLDAIIHRCSLVAASLKNSKMELIIEIHSISVNPELSANSSTTTAIGVPAHIQTFEHQLKQALTLTPVAIIASAGSDLWTLNEKLAFFGEASSRVVQVSPTTTSVFFTTAFGFGLSHPWESLRVLSQFPKLQLHLDLGQWCCAASSLPDDPVAVKHWSALLHRVSSNTTSIVAAIGSEQCARVLHPADVACARELRLHEHWWSKCWQAAVSSRDHHEDQHIATPLFVEVENPTPGVEMPLSHVPVVLPLEIARWSKRRLETLFQITIMSKTSAPIAKLPPSANRKRSNVISDTKLDGSNTIVNDNIASEYAIYDISFEDCTSPDEKVSALTCCLSSLKDMVKHINDFEDKGVLTMQAEWKQMGVDVSSIATQDVLDAFNPKDDDSIADTPGNFVIAVEGKNNDIFRVAYVARNDDTVREIGMRLGIETHLLISLNEPKYQGLRGGSKLIEGTWVLLTPFQQRPQKQTQSRKRKKSIGSTRDPEVLWESAIKTARTRLQLQAHEPAITNPDVFHTAVMLWDEMEGTYSDVEGNSDIHDHGGAASSCDVMMNEQKTLTPDGDADDDGDDEVDGDGDDKKQKKLVQKNSGKKKTAPKKKTTSRKSLTPKKQKQSAKTLKPIKKKAKKENVDETDDADPESIAGNHNDGNNTNTNAHANTTNNDCDDDKANIDIGLAKEKEEVAESSSDDEEIPMYETKNNDTFKMIAELFDIDVKTLLELNKKRFPGIKLSSKFMAGTFVFLPELNASLPVSE